MKIKTKLEGGSVPIRTPRACGMKIKTKLSAGSVRIPIPRGCG